MCWLQDAKSSKGSRPKEEEVDFGDLSDESGSEQSSIGEDATSEGSRKAPSVPLVAQYPTVPPPPRQLRAAQHREGQRAPPRLPKEEQGARQRVQQPSSVSGAGYCT